MANEAAEVCGRGGDGEDEDDVDSALWLKKCHILAHDFVSFTINIFGEPTL